MTDRPEEQRQLENLELNKETLTELSPPEADQARGGMLQKGQDLHVARQGLRQWGDTYMGKEPPVVLRSKADGRPVVAALIPGGEAHLGMDDVEIVPAR